MHPIKIQLFPKADTDNQIYHIGKLKFNGTINCGKQSFLIYLDEDIKELHIAPAGSPDLTDVFRYYTDGRKKTSRSKHNNIAVELDMRHAEDGKVFYIGRLDIGATIDASQGLVFLIFTADPGEEELQISFPEQKCDKENAGRRQKVSSLH